jgi:hypothetical protein
MTRKLLWPVLAIGALLVVMPFAFQMPSRTAAGARMMNDFRPIMQPAQVAKTAYYYNAVFTPLGKVAPAINTASVAKFEQYVKGFQGMQSDSQKLLPMLAQALHMTPAQVQAYMARQVPTMTAMLASLPTMQRDFGGFIGMMIANTAVFGQVNGGLAHYKPLVRTMQANTGNFAQIDALPSFRLFTWFFVVPGALLVLLAGFGLLEGRHVRIRAGRAHPTPA